MILLVGVINLIHSWGARARRRRRRSLTTADQLKREWTRPGPAPFSRRSQAGGRIAARRELDYIQPEIIRASIRTSVAVRGAGNNARGDSPLPTDIVVNLFGGGPRRCLGFGERPRAPAPPTYKHAANKNNKVEIRRPWARRPTRAVSYRRSPSGRRQDIV
ncbi:hypothetical protein EVAR_32591_1 [Eumeta japonica]|uniref:Uncharacterized protein n=1 Tax=Eumeta variegata TaxID=151549 RepID=A0A4C1VPT8_EUMVA|nr:hypothetical protein EVAR_32591_1 [Eumeta japonica]